MRFASCSVIGILVIAFVALNPAHAGQLVGDKACGIVSELRDLQTNIEGKRLRQPDLSRFRAQLLEIEKSIQREFPSRPYDNGDWRSLMQKVGHIEKLLGPPRRAERSRSPRPSLPLAPPPNDDCANATPVGNGEYAGRNTDAGVDGSASCDYSDSSGDVWYAYTASTGGPVIVGTKDSTFVPIVSIHTNCPGTEQNEIACDEYGGSGWEARALFYPSSGSQYLIRVGGMGSDTGDFTLNISPAGSVVGDVVDAANSTPLDGLYVSLYDSTGNYVETSSTDPSGEFAFPNLPPGTYFAAAERDDVYVSEIYDNLVCTGYCDPATGTPITVNAGSSTTIHFALDRGGVISGTATDAATGAPLAGVYVIIYDSSGYSAAAASSDELGHYAAGGLPTGAYYALAETGLDYIDELYNNKNCPNGWCDPTTGDSISVTMTQESSGIDFALDRGGSISGTVTDAATGAPIQYDEVHVYIAQWNQAGYAVTDYLGNYVVGGLPAGSYFAVTRDSNDYVDELFDNIPCPGSCDPTTGTPILVLVANNTAGVNFALDRGGSISGVITNSATGVPLEGIEVYAVDASGNWGDDGLTNYLGQYVIGGLLNGNHYAYTYTRTYSHFQDEIYDNIPCPTDYCDPTVGNIIPVTIPNDTPGIDFALQPLGTISGRVMDATGTVPLVGIEVDAINQNGNYVSGDNTDYLGNYVISGLKAGTYHVRTNGIYGADEYIDELYDNIPCPSVGPLCDPLTGTPVTVNLSSNTGGIDFALDRAGSITGTVMDLADSSPLYNSYVDVYDSSGNRLFDVQADFAGRYSLRGLPAGNYYLIAEAADHVTELYDNIPCPEFNCDPISGTPVAVSLNSVTSGIDFALQKQTAFLFQDDFDDGVLDTNWTYSKGEWMETGSQLFVTASKKAAAIAQPVFSGCSLCTVQANLQTQGGSDSRVWLVGWYQDKSNYVELMVNEESDKWVLKQHVAGKVAAKKGFASTIDPLVYYDVKITYDGGNFRVSVNNVPLFSMPSVSPASGTVGFKAKATNASFDNILVYQ